MLQDKISSALPAGVCFRPALLDKAAQHALLADVRRIVAAAPLFTPTMPCTGRPFSVAMTNCGPLGWVSDKAGGYRYQAHHPVTGEPWPQMPESVQAIWAALAPEAAPPQACLINFYSGAAKMGLHVDRDEADFTAPIVSMSLGDDARFLIGGAARSDATVALRLASGDGLALGGPARLAYHGIARIYAATSTLLAEGGRINLTLRRVTAV